MVRTVITPRQTDILLAIPESYIGKKIEVTFFALEELFEDKQPHLCFACTVPTPLVLGTKCEAHAQSAKQKTLGEFFGVLAENDFQQLKEYTTQARKEWDRVF